MFFVLYILELVIGRHLKFDYSYHISYVWRTPRTSLFGSGRTCSFPKDSTWTSSARKGPRCHYVVLGILSSSGGWPSFVGMEEAMGGTPLG